MELQTLVQLVGTVGLPGALVVAFVIWGNAREKVVNERLSSQEHFIRNALHELSIKATLAIAESTRVQEKVIVALNVNTEATRDCMVLMNNNEMRQVKRFERAG